MGGGGSSSSLSSAVSPEEEDLELAEFLLERVTCGAEEASELSWFERGRLAANRDFDFEGAHGACFELEGVYAHRVASNAPWLVL